MVEYYIALLSENRYIMKKYTSKEDIEEKDIVLEEPEAAYASSVSVDRGDNLPEVVLRQIVDSSRLSCDVSEGITGEELLARLAPKIKAMFE